LAFNGSWLSCHVAIIPTDEHDYNRKNADSNQAGTDYPPHSDTKSGSSEETLNALNTSAIRLFALEHLSAVGAKQIYRFD
jgi:hypothetical protein